MSKSAQEILEAASARTGWLEISLVGILLQYIENQGSNDAFAAFIAQRVADEECSTSSTDDVAAHARTEQSSDATANHAMCPGQEPAHFAYQLLARLQMDCEYYLGDGNRATKHLWAGSEAAQIRKMRELYESLPLAPDWITLERIEQYAAAMVPASA